MVTEYKDFYALLGISDDASSDEIKKAFRRQSKIHHPDVNLDKIAATECFKDINEAYQVLSDEDQRRRYDRIYETMRHGFTGSRPPSSTTGRNKQKPPGHPPHAESGTNGNQDNRQRSHTNEKKDTNFESLSLPDLDNLLKSTGHSSTFESLSRKAETGNRVAAEIVIPRLNLVLSSVSTWLSWIVTDEEDQVRRKNITDSLRRFMESVIRNPFFLKGAALRVGFPYSLEARLIAHCCQFVSDSSIKAKIGIEPSADHTVINIVFLGHGDTLYADVRTPWETAKERVRNTLNNQVNLYDITYHLEDLSNTTQFLKTPGIVNAQAVWLKQHDLEGFDDETIVTMKALFTEIDTLMVNPSAIDVRTKIEEKIDAWLENCRQKYPQSSALQKFADTLKNTLGTEITMLKRLENPNETPTKKIKAVKALAELGCHYRMDGSKSWSDFLDVFKRAVETRDANLSSLAANMNGLPDKYQLRELYLIVLLQSNRKFEEYLNYVEKSQASLFPRISNTEMSKFEETITRFTSKGFLEKFKLYALDHSIEAFSVLFAML